LLYSGWPKEYFRPTPDGGGDAFCEEVTGQSCEIGSKCIDAGGSIFYNFECPDFGVCCSIKVQEESCYEKDGILCSSNEQCSGLEVPSPEGPCCTEGTCSPLPQQNTCTPEGGVCALYCTDEEEQDYNLVCSIPGEVCCMEKEPENPTTNYTWIIILAILIILVIIAIIFRKKIQMLWFSRKNKSGKPKSPPGYRPSPPPGYRPGPRPMLRLAPRPAPHQSPRHLSVKDKEMEETLKKLREISK